MMTIKKTNNKLILCLIILLSLIGCAKEKSSPPPQDQHIDKFYIFIKTCGDDLCNVYKFKNPDIDFYDDVYRVETESNIFYFSYDLYDMIFTIDENNPYWIQYQEFHKFIGIKNT